MANYTLANLVKAQVKLAGEFASNDQRYRIPAVFKLFVQGSGQFFPNYQTLRTSEKRPLEANYFTRTAAALTTTGRAHDHTGTHGDSGVLTPSFTTYSSTFSTTLKQADSSVFSWQEQFNNEIRNKIIDFADGLDAVASTYLFSNRTGVNAAAVKGAFDGTNDVYEIAIANKDEAITITKVVADILKYQGQVLDVVCDAYSYTEFLRQAAQGATNATNLSFQFLGVTFILDASLGAKAVALDVTYVTGFWLAVPRGHVGMLDWIPAQNRMSKETTVNMYGSLNNPVDGLQYAVHSYETRADGTAVNGEKQDVVTQTEISIDIALDHAPDSVANQTPIMAFAIV